MSDLQSQLSKAKAEVGRLQVELESKTARVGSLEKQVKELTAVSEGEADGQHTDVEALVL